MAIPWNTLYGLGAGAVPTGAQISLVASITWDPDTIKHQIISHKQRIAGHRFLGRPDAVHVGGERGDFLQDAVLRDDVDGLRDTG